MRSLLDRLPQTIQDSRTQMKSRPDALEPAARTLPPDEVHVWYDLLHPDEDDARAAAARRILTSGEWDRCQRYIFPDGRRESLAARCLVRSVLSQYDTIRPSDWRFRSNEHGRPEIAGPAHGSPLRFNLSHAGGVVVLAVSAHYHVGVDVEPLDRHAALDLADAYFARSEVAALRALPDTDQPRRFLEYWTLKEAYLKARGTGLALPLDQFGFDVTSPDRPSVSFEPGFGDEERAWQFDRLFLGGTHIVAVATQRGAAPSVRIVVHAFGGGARGRERET